MTEKPPGREKPKKRKKSSAAKNKGGRPEWKPSADDRITIERMKFCGDAEAVIARAFGVDVDTLKKHCPDELENGYANRRREVVNLMFESAKAKNTSAIKRLDETGRAVGAANAVNARGEKKPEPKPAALGKKEQRKQAATSVGGKFAAPAPPKLVVNNDKSK